MKLITLIIYEFNFKGYFNEGFLQIQKAIDFALISEFDSAVNNITAFLNRFPYPPYNDDGFIAVLQALFPFIIILSYNFTVILTAKGIVQEKESGIKEAMKLMGMKSWIYWLSWYIKTLTLFLPALIFMIAAYKIQLPLKDGGQASIINKTDPVLFAIFLILYTSSTITFTFLMCTFFKKAESARSGSGIIFFVTYLPFILIQLRYEKMNLFTKILSCFVSNICVSLGIQLIGMFEGKGVGITFSNWNQGISVEDNFAFSHVIIMLIVNNFTHILLAYYLETIFPGNHGIGRPWYFPIQSFLKNDDTEEKNLSLMGNKTTEPWYKRMVPGFMRNKNKTSDIVLNTKDPILEDESIYSKKKIGIKINKIAKKFKQFGETRYAVKDLSLNIYEGQITVLLGHNGAGKR